MAALAQSMVAKQERAHQRICERTAEQQQSPEHLRPRQTAIPPRAEGADWSTRTATKDPPKDTNTLEITDTENKIDANSHDTQAAEKIQEEKDADTDLLLATCAEHMRHIARTTQQLMAALSVHLDAINTRQKAQAIPTTPPHEEEC